MIISSNKPPIAGLNSNEPRIAKNSDIIPSIEIDLNSKTIKKTEAFPTIVAGDNNSTSLTIKAPKEYEGRDLSDIDCVISYATDWTDEDGKVSMGQVDLTSSRVVEDSYIMYTWVLDIQQTAKAGKCDFSIHFLYNLTKDPFINNVNVYPLEQDDIISLTQTGIDETELRYWSVSCKPSSFEIKPNAMRLGADYNLVLPNDFETQLNTINETIVSIVKSKEDIEDVAEQIQKILTDLQTELQGL